ncbi:hypothetical protein ACJ5HV_03135 [Staphylococcus aureus]
MLKVVFRQVTKDITKIIKMKNNQAYHLTQANEYFTQLIDAAETYKEEKGTFIKIGIDLVDENNIQNFSASDVTIDGNFSTINELVKYLLTTDDKSRDNFDNGMSDYDEEAKEIIERLENKAEIKKTTSNTKVKTTNKSFNPFKKLIKSTNRKLENVQDSIEFSSEKVEDSLINENTIKYEKSMTDNEYVEKENEDVPEEQEDDAVAGTETSEETAVEDEDNLPFVVNQNEEETEEVAKEVPPVVEESGHENNGFHDKNELFEERQITIPTFELVKPQFKKKELVDVASKDVQEWLNIKEYERVNLTNQAITDINESITNFYLKKKIENENTLKKYEEEYNNFDQELENYRNELMIDDQSKLESYFKEKESYIMNLNSNKEVEINNEIEAFKQSKNSELEKYRLDNEQVLNEDVEQKRSMLKEDYEKNMINKQAELENDFRKNKYNYQNELDNILNNSVKSLYEKHKGESYRNIVEFNKQVSVQLDQVREIAKQHEANLEKEKTKQKEIELEKNHLQDKEAERIQINNELKLVSEKKEKIIEENKKNENEERERRLLLDEQKQKDYHEAKMREIELKYTQSQKDELPAGNENKTFNKKKLVILLGLGFLLILITVLVLSTVNGAEKELSYSDYVEEDNYKAITNEYPDQVDNLSKQLYTNNDSEGLKVLAQNATNPTVDLRYHLSQRNYKEALEVLENVENINTLTDKELREIAELYINDRDYEKASQINSVLQDTEINRRLAESTYYEQYKENLESTIANSKEEENVENAKKELEQVNIILNSK